MNYLDINPTFNCDFSAKLGDITYKFTLLWSDVNGWLMSISKPVNGQYITIISGLALRLDVDCFSGLSEPVSLIPRYEEPTLNNIGTTCLLEVINAS